MSMTRHRCEQWCDIKIHPDSDWLWGTCLEFYPGPIKGRKDQPDLTNIWAMLDEKSGTFSIWGGPECPFCRVELKGLQP